MRGRKTRATTTGAAAVRKTIGYARVSTDDQAEGGVSLADQESRIQAYATAIGCELADIIVDAGVSAKTLQRGGLEIILAGIEDGTIGRVLVTKLDRLTRSVRDLAKLLELAAKHDVALVSIAESLDTASARRSRSGPATRSPSSARAGAHTARRRSATGARAISLCGTRQSMRRSSTSFRCMPTATAHR